MNATLFYIMDETRRHVSQCRSEQSRLGSARDMRTVRDIAYVSVPSILRGMPDARNAVRDLEHVAEKRMNVLLDEQLRQLGEIQAMEEFKKEYGRLVRNEWPFLRGTFSSVLVRAERAASVLRHTLEKALKPTDHAEPAVDGESDAPR